MASSNPTPTPTSDVPASAASRPSAQADRRMRRDEFPPLETRPTKPPAPPSTIPRILIITSESRKLSSLSPFQRKDGCDRMGQVLRCDKLRDGGIEVEFANEKDAEKALVATEFTFKEGRDKRLTKLPIAVSPHRSKNSSRDLLP